MKFAGVLLLVFSGVWLAAKIYLSYTKRIAVLRQLLSDCEVIKNEVVLKKSTLCDSLSKVKEEGILSRFYENILKLVREGDGVREAFLKSLSHLSDCIKKEDERAVSDFARLLGGTDMDGQIRAFDIFESEIRKNLSEAEQSKKEKMKSECATVIFTFAAVGLIVI